MKEYYSFMADQGIFHYETKHSYSIGFLIIIIAIVNSLMDISAFPVIQTYKNHLNVSAVINSWNQLNSINNNENQNSENIVSTRTPG